MSAPAAAGVDIAIVGGGMVGASLALALRGTRMRVALIEAARPGAGAHASFDDRTTALGNGARRVFETLGLWPSIAACAAPIRTIHVSDAGRFGFARLNAEQHGIDAFGYCVSNRHIGQVVWGALAQSSALELLAPARVIAMQLRAQMATLTLSEGSGTRELEARLVVAADGANSLIKQAAGIASESTSYEQVAVIANLRTDRPSTGVAYERFAPTGPMALLPLFDGSYTAVWSVSPEAAVAIMSYADERFCAELQRVFGWRAGRFLAVGARASYPLVLTRASSSHALRTVVVGNAAQTLHPVAAQGFNLGLRDAALLAELVATAPDPGDAALLADFGRRRAQDRDSMVGFTDQLVKLFGDRRPGVRALRDLGLLLFDLAPPAKRALAALSWGFGPRLPKLVRGVPLA